MTNTIDVDLPKPKMDKLTAESSDVLKQVKKDSTVKAFVEIRQYQIRTEINLASAGLSNDQAVKAEKEAQKEANKFQGELEDKIDNLVKRLKDLQAKDKLGDAKAGDEAQKEVKKCADEIDDTLPDFGIRIRKAVERGSGKKLTSGCKSLSSGRFGSDPKIKLVAQFEHAGASAEVAKDYLDAAKSLDKAKQMIAEEVKTDKKTTDALRASIATTRKEADELRASAAKMHKETVELNARNKPADETKAKSDTVEFDKLIAEIPRTAESFVKTVDLYSKSIGDFAALLRKTREAYNKESTEMKKDLSTPELKLKKSKLDQVGKELLDLQSVVTKRLTDSKQIAQQFREAEKIKIAKDATLAERVKAAKEWQDRLAEIQTQVAKFGEIDTTAFNKAIQNMVTESKKDV